MAPDHMGVPVALNNSYLDITKSDIMSPRQLKILQERTHNNNINIAMIIKEREHITPAIQDYKVNQKLKLLKRERNEDFFLARTVVNHRTRSSCR